jgi:hypothetical protein
MPEIKVEQIAKTFALGVGVSYAIGMMILNGYLASVGIADFDPFRPRAIVSGVWFILLIAVGFLAEDSIDRSFKMKELPRGWATGNAFFVFLGTVFFYFLILGLVEVAHPNRLGALLVVSIAMFLLPASALHQARNAHKEWKRRASEDKVGPTSTAFLVFHCLWSVAAVILFSALFIQYVYLFVPQQYGGGKPRIVQMAVKDGAAQALNDLAIPTKRNIIDGRVELIHETSETVAFRLTGGKTIVLARSEIVAIQAN